MVYAWRCSKFQLLPKFKEYDADGNGYITLEEASFILENPPFNFPPSKVIFLLKHFDKDGNGKLDIEEFAGFYAEAKATSVCAVFFSARCNIYISRLCYDFSVRLSVRLSVCLWRLCIVVAGCNGSPISLHAWIDRCLCYLLTTPHPDRQMWCCRDFWWKRGGVWKNW